MRILIDTNAYSDLIRGDMGIARLLEQSDIVYLSVIVLGELLTGFKKGSREQENRQILDSFQRKGGKTVLLPVTPETSERFAQINATLRLKGRPIPVNDIWIAAQCLENGAVLLTKDAHFEEVDGLLIRGL